VTAKPWQDIRVLIAGCGSIGRRHARVLRSLGVRPPMICDPSEDQRRGLAGEVPVEDQFTDYLTALSAQPEAVFVCTPTALHVPMALAAVRAGAHVLVEKPLSNSLEGIEELQEALEENGKVLMVAFCFRFHEGLCKAKVFVEQGRVGRLLSARFRMSEDISEVRPDYRGLFSLRQGGVYDLTHELDLACWYFGGHPVGVRAMHGNVSDLGFSAPDIALIDLRFSGGGLAQIYLDYFSRPRTRMAELMGTEGTIRVEFASWDACTVSLYPRAAQAWREERLSTERDSMFREEDREFLLAARGECAVSIPLEEGLKSLGILAEAQEHGAL
jgi:predicted dehydrogenase